MSERPQLVAVPPRLALGPAEPKRWIVHASGLKAGDMLISCDTRVWTEDPLPRITDIDPGPPWIVAKHTGRAGLHSWHPLEQVVVLRPPRGA